MSGEDLAKQHFFSALDCLDRGDLANADRYFRATLEIVPAHGPSLANLASVLVHRGHFEEGREKAEQAAAVGPPNADVLNTLGFALGRLGRYPEAIKAADDALKIDPSSIDAQLTRANALRRLGRSDEALSVYDRLLSADPESEDAALGRATALAQAQRFEEAFPIFERLLSKNPRLAIAWTGLGNALVSSHQSYTGAVTAFDRAIEISPDLADAWAGRGGAFMAMRDFERALPNFERALSLDPHQRFLRGERFGCAALLCDWTHREEDIREMRTAIEQGRYSASPSALLDAFDEPVIHLNASRAYANLTFPAISTKPPSFRGGHSGKIRLGYFSSDFGDHATSFLIAKLFTLHDRSRFDVIGFPVGPARSGDMADRVRNSFDEWFELGSGSSVESCVRTVRAQQIDIAIDLNGYVQEPRPGIFAARVAPIQVAYLGYPSTMGTSFIDYMIADKIVAPLSQRANFAEHLAYLPNCYQVNDTTARIVPDAPVFRLDHGLPDVGFVFCCFNNNNKINPDIFSDWMTILRRVPGSVLWLLKNSDVVAQNLRREASVRGIDPSRLIFAPRTDLPNHLARHRLAGLFLDTLPYNAHTTTSDALWTGLPVLTLQGNAFAGRVAASILTAVGVQDELVTFSREEYVERAIALATEADRLDRIRKRLAENVRTSSLFDVEGFATDLESLYEAMYQRHVSGLPPAELSIGV